MRRLYFIFSLFFCIISCTNDIYDESCSQNIVENDFQQNKLDCVCGDLAKTTNFYGMGEPVITRANGHPKEYYLCIEDMGGKSLDYNDIVIHGGRHMQSRIIYRGGSYKIRITHANKVFETGINEYGETNILLPFKNMNRPDSWHGAVFTVYNGNTTYTIPITLKNINNQPAVIATSVDYNFHKDENTMTSDEFINIPFYK